MSTSSQEGPVDAAARSACHGGQREAAEMLLNHGADLNWIGYDNLAPVDAARRSGAHALVQWLLEKGATRAEDRR